MLNKFFPHIIELAEICQSMPVSNSWPERGASTIKRIKTRLRSFLKQDMIMTLMNVSIKPLSDQALEAGIDWQISTFLMMLHHNL
jgi:hypothetical protein